MATSSSQESGDDVPALQDLLKCIICMETYHHPKLLHCGHTFCQACLSHLPLNNRAVLCPVCRKSTPVVNGVNQLQNDFRVTQIRDAFQSVVLVNKTHECDICRSGGKYSEGGFSCLQCMKKMCDDCITNHEKQQQFKRHTVVKSSRACGTVLCRTHNEQSTHLCKTCMKLVCVTCMLTNCSGHECHELGLAVKNVSNAVIKLTENLEHRISQITENIDKHDSIITDKTAMFDALEQKIRQHTSEMLRTIQERGASLLHELHEKKNDFLECYQVSRIESNERLRILSAIREIAAGMNDPAIKPQLLTILPSIHTMSRSPWSPELPSTKSCIFRAETSANVGRLITVRDPPILVDRIDDPFPNALFPEDSCEITPSAPSAPPDSFDAEEICLSEMRNQFRGFTDAWGACFVRDCSQVAISDRRLNKVVLHSVQDDMQVLADSRLHGFQLHNPHAILYHPSMECILTVSPEGGGLTYLNPTDLSRVNHILLPKVFSPVGLGILRNGQLIVSEVGSKRHGLSIHDPQGPCLRTWGNKKSSQGGWSNIFRSEEHSMDYPYYVATDHHDRIIVSDYTRQEIQIFDVGGKFLRRFGDSHILGKPAGISVDSRNNIVVAHSMPDREVVSVFSSDGLIVNNPLENDNTVWGALRSLVIQETEMCVVTESQCMVYGNQYEMYHPCS